MTTENVTVLFTDIVGSTALASSLAPDAADALRREHFSILRQAVAEAGGTEVKNLGDGLMVVFATSSAALSCAVGMQQGIERDNRAGERTVGLRVGLSAGEVTREDDDYFGEPVIEASRLCAASERAQILAADVVRAMAGRRSRHACRPLGELTLKGLLDPVATVEVTWEPLGGADTDMVIPLPARLSVGPTVGVVGRAPEISTMADAFKRVVSGAGREVILVSGEAGLGKTTLVAESARAAFDGGACVLFGHCEEDLATPYQLLSEALGHYVTHAPEDELVAHVTAHGSELVRLIPALARRIPDLPPSQATDSDSERFLLFAAAVSLLAAASEQQPIVIVLDDLQWADKASLLLLRHLIASELPMRVLIVGTYRDQELSRSHPFVETLAALHRQRGVSRIELAGLDDTGVVALMEARAGHALDDAGVGLAHALYRETDGNPFFVSEVLIHLAETGAIAQDAAGRWTASGALDQMALPESVRVVIGARVGRLGADAEHALSIAAVIGRDFDVELLARATNTPEDDVLDILEAAAGVALVREIADAQGRYNFAHALIQRTLYEDLGPSRRGRAHRAVAVALEDLCGGRPGARVGELARHWLSASQPVDLAKAIGYSRAAGDAALAALAPADALRYYAQALDLYGQVADPDPDLGLDLEIGLGTAQRQTGDPAFRDTLLGAARRAGDLGDTDRLVAAALATDRGFYSSAGVIDAEQVAILELALDLVPVDHPERALLLAQLCSELAFGTPLERRQALADEALSIAEASGDNVVIVRVLNHVNFPLYTPHLRAQVWERTAEAQRRAALIGDSVLQYWANHWRMCFAPLGCDIDERDRCAAMNRELTERIDQPFLRWTWGLHHTNRALIAGDTDEAERRATECLQLGTESGLPDAVFMFGVHLSGVHWQRGTFGDLLPVMEEMHAQAPDIAKAAFDSGLAIAYADTGRHDDARRLLAEFAQQGCELAADAAWAITMTAYAAAAIECREPGIARSLFDLLAPFADQLSTNSGARSDGHVSQFLGGLATVLGRYDEADAFFARAAVFNDRFGARFFGAETDLQWGRMLADRAAPGDAERSRTLLARAHATATAHAYGSVERRARASLQQLDSR